jgi:hypothetical protein
MSSKRIDIASSIVSPGHSPKFMGTSASSGKYVADAVIVITLSLLLRQK